MRPGIRFTVVTAAAIAVCNRMAQTSAVFSDTTSSAPAGPPRPRRELLLLRGGLILHALAGAAAAAGPRPALGQEPERHALRGGILELEPAEGPGGVMSATFNVTLGSTTPESLPSPREFYGRIQDFIQKCVEGERGPPILSKDNPSGEAVRKSVKQFLKDLEIKTAVLKQEGSDREYVAQYLLRSWEITTDNFQIPVLRINVNLEMEDKAQLYAMCAVDLANAAVSDVKTGLSSALWVGGRFSEQKEAGLNCVLPTRVEIPSDIPGSYRVMDEEVPVGKAVENMKELMNNGMMRKMVLEKAREIEDAAKTEAAKELQRTMDFLSKTP